mgnify:CR=1 FL=1
MPKMDGYEATGLIKKFRPDLPIIAQSAYSLEQYREKFGTMTFDDYISKPIDEEELRNKFMKYIGKQV